jgi:dihydrofolate reductase
MKLHLIWAQARNGVIGRDGSMPWHLPEDLAHLKAKTLGSPVIMGRKTWESIPSKFRPLPGRRNIVLTRATSWTQTGAEVTNNLREALQKCEHAENVWVLGGGEIYVQALPLAHSAEVTEIDADIDGDAFAPQFGPDWVKTSGAPQVSSTGLKFSFNTYRNTAVQPQPN